MTPIYNYLMEETLFAEKEKARAVRRKPRPYAVINGVIYKKSYLGAWLRYVGQLQENYVLREIHEGSCSMHAGTRSVVAKAIRTGDNRFKDWCEKLCIRQHFASVKHLQTNGLVERANRILGEGIKARLDERSKDWIEEIPHVVKQWRYAVLTHIRNGVVIPAEIGMPTLRTSKIDIVQNDEALEINLDILEERREQAAIRKARSKAKMENITTPKSATQASDLETLCTGTTMPAMQKIVGILALSGKDRTK
ncbi:reverse transcriptase domain-containing protein [Tanacetum coccineum]